MSTINTTAAITMAAFKAIVNTTAINVRKARKTGNLYGVNDSDELVCRFAKDVKFDEPIVALKQHNSEDGSEWWFCINGVPTPAENIATL